MEHIFDYIPRPKPNQPFQIALEIKTGKENLYIISVAPAGSILFDQHTTTGRVIHKNEVRVCFHSRDGFHTTGIFQIKIEQLDDPTIFFDETIIVVEPEAEKPVETKPHTESVTEALIKVVTPTPNETTSTTLAENPVKVTTSTVKANTETLDKDAVKTTNPPAKKNWGREVIAFAIFTFLFFVDLFSKKSVQWILLIIVGIIGAYFVIDHFEKTKTPTKIDQQVKPQMITPDTPKVLPTKNDIDAGMLGTDTQNVDAKAVPEPDTANPEPTQIQAQPQAENPPKCGACP